MADVTLTGVERSGDTLTLTGTGFTKTTTTVYVDGESVPFECPSDTEITVNSPEGSKVAVEKGEIKTDEMAISSSGSGNQQPSVSEHGEDDLADAPAEELDHAASAGAQEKAAPPPATDPKTATHVPAEGFRQAVHNQPAGDLNMDPREPYPTGKPPDQRETFHHIHGHYPDDKSGNPPDAQAAQMDADPET